MIRWRKIQVTGSSGKTQEQKHRLKISTADRLLRDTGPSAGQRKQAGQHEQKRLLAEHERTGADCPREPAGLSAGQKQPRLSRNIEAAQRQTEPADCPDAGHGLSARAKSQNRPDCPHLDKDCPTAKDFNGGLSAWTWRTVRRRRKPIQQKRRLNRRRQILPADRPR
jgi:hypothetical protein